MIESSTYLNDARAIWLRDVKSEFRTRYAVNAIFMFAFTVLIAISFSIGSFSIDPSLQPFLYSVLLWIILIFSALTGLPRSFIKEKDAKTLDLLKLSTRPEAVFLGKWFFNVSMILTLAVIITPVFIFLMKFTIADLKGFILIIFLALLGLSASTTIVAAMIAGAGTRSALFSALSLPLILPIMIIGIKGCEKAATGLQSSGMPEIKIAFAYTIIMFTISFILFPVVWKE